MNLAGLVGLYREATALKYLDLSTSSLLKILPDLSLEISANDSACPEAADALPHHRKLAGADHHKQRGHLQAWPEEPPVQDWHQSADAAHPAGHYDNCADSSGFSTVEFFFFKKKDESICGCSA